MEDGVGDAGDLDHFSDVVHADDVRPTKDRGRDRCGGAPNALAGRYQILGIRSCSTWAQRGATPLTAGRAIPGKCCAATRKRRPYKGLARSARHKRKAQRCEFRKVRQKLVILLKTFAESNTGVEQDLRLCHACLTRPRYTSAQAGDHVAQDVART